MNLRFPSTFVIFLLFISCSKDPSNAFVMNQSEDYTAQQLTMLEAIHNEATPINNKPLDLNDDQLMIFDQFSSTRLVGLGEATHGTKEFFQMKHRIFKYLVENHGFDAFLFEMDVAEGRIFNDWVQWRRDDDITELMANKMIFWGWNTEEVRALLRYIRSYNEGKAESEMIGFYGVDTQVPDYDLIQLVDILKAANIKEADTVRRKNANYYDLWQFPKERLTEIQLSIFEDGLEYAKQIVNDNEDKIRDTLGEHELKWAKQLVRHMEQVQENFFGLRLDGTYDLRDQYMAENTNWYFDLLGQDSKFVLWAHNGHLANSDKLFRKGSQGFHLKNEFGEDYQIIGFSFANGDFTSRERNSPYGPKAFTLSEEPLANSTNYLLHHSSLENYILPLNSTLDEWLDESRLFLNLGSSYNQNPEDYYFDVELSKEYDYIIHFDITDNTDVLTK